MARNAGTQPLEVIETEAAWDETVDVLVVGFGGAGACAAIEAADNGARVLAVDKFDGGGATAASGGICYAGGTRYQREAGFDDTPENMFRYLRAELDGVVSDDLLMRFCQETAGDLDWLTDHGLRFSGAFDEEKTSYPAKGVFLYYSGNEYNPRFADIATAAPRGHRTIGEGLTGGVFFAGLRDAAIARGVRLWQNSPATRLITALNGAVLGAEIRQFAPSDARLSRHQRIYRRAKRFVGMVGPEAAAKAVREVAEIDRGATIVKRVRALRGVVLTTGGFIFNRSMVADHAPLYADAQPLGTPGCDGSGIALGVGAGGATRKMDSVMASRSIAPPSVQVEGLVVDGQGQRITAEDEYTCTLGRRIAEAADGKAWLVLDDAHYRQALRLSLPGKGRLLLIHCLPNLIGHLFGSKKSDSLDGLARKCGVPPDTFRNTVHEFNRIGRGEIDDPFGKKKEYRKPLGAGPYHAMDISLRSKTAPLITLTLGGLDVEEDTGLVRRTDGGAIPGLHAAGRAAVGVCSNYYLSGLALADCVFSGRRAGRHAALTGMSPHFKPEKENA